MGSPALYRRRMRAGVCADCGAARAFGSVHYCEKCLIKHREYQRGSMHERRQDEAFRTRENEAQRERMRKLRARRRKQRKCRMCELPATKGRRYCLGHLVYVRRERKTKRAPKPVNGLATHPG